jgi:hypothetical protein
VRGDRAGSCFARVFGYAAVPMLLAALAGPILAGTILKYLGWPWLFYINLGNRQIRRLLNPTKSRVRHPRRECVLSRAFRTARPRAFAG